MRTKGNIARGKGNIAEECKIEIRWVGDREQVRYEENECDTGILNQERIVKRVKDSKENII